MKLTFEWVGVPDPTTGYGNHSYQILKILKARGHRIRFIPMWPGRQQLPPFFQSLNAKIKPTTKKIIRVNCIPPFPIYAKNRYNIIYTMMESVTLHPGVANRLRTAHEVWTPSKFVYTLFKKHGVPKDKLFVMPEGMDSNLYNFPTAAIYPDELTAPFKRLQEVMERLPIEHDYKYRPFTILSVLTWNWRKGWDVLLRAYFRAFTPSDPVVLLLHTYIPQGRGYYSNIQILKDIYTIKAQEHIEYDLPIMIFTDPLPEEEMPGLYASADVFFLPTRGEGFCLPALEAMAAGTPPIITRGSGQSMFCERKNSFLINAPTFTRYPGDPYQIQHFYQGQLFQEPDADHAAHLLQKAFKNPKIIATKAHFGAALAHDKFMWEKSADMIESRLRYLTSRL